MAYKPKHLTMQMHKSLKHSIGIKQFCLVTSSVICNIAYNQPVWSDTFKVVTTMV